MTLTRSRRRTAALALGLAGVLAFPTLAHADNVVNDVTMGGTDTIVAGSSTTVSYKINGTGGDGQAGCNADDGTPATVRLSVPTGVTASASELVFSACNAFTPVTLSASAPGSYPIDVASISDSGDGKGAYKNEANFTLKVLPPQNPPPQDPTPQDSTPPVIAPTVTGTLGDNDWYTSDVGLSWSVTDAESTVTPSGCGATSITADQPATDYTCSATSAGGSDSRTVSIKRDATKPTVSVTGVNAGATYTLGSVPAAGCDTTDALSGVATGATGSPSGGPVGSVTYSCDGAKDNAGNAGTATSVSYNVRYAWSQFQRPVDNAPTVNSVKAGAAVPVKFSLSGNQGLGILNGAPTSGRVTCNTTAPVDAVEDTATAGSSGLTYDPISDTYSYVWKTDKAWAGTCRQLNVKLNDGSTYTAHFSLLK